MWFQLPDEEAEMNERKKSKGSDKHIGKFKHWNIIFNGVKYVEIKKKKKTMATMMNVCPRD